jgi:hypothetical protein
MTEEDFVCLTGPKDQVMDVIWEGLQPRINERIAKVAFTITLMTFLEVIRGAVDQGISQEQSDKLLEEVMGKLIIELRKKGYLIKEEKVLAFMTFLEMAADGASDEDIGVALDELDIPV